MALGPSVSYSFRWPLGTPRDAKRVLTRGSSRCVASRRRIFKVEPLASPKCHGTTRSPPPTVALCTFVVSSLGADRATPTVAHQ